MRYSDSTNLASSNTRPKSHHYKKMASTTATKRAWKLQEFVAHGSSVNCLALGRKSGRVLVTGGEDKKVNLWAVGKPNCIMSLTGHTTPVECVRFSYSDEFVCAGSLSGALKIWDLEAAKILRTLTGHKANIKSLDFHPYGDFLASGSSDTNIKLWDIKRKGCIFTYKGHTSTVNSIKFSPDGRWIASAGEDGAVKIWDLPAGKMLAEFRSHIGAVRDVEFHPNEFLLASGSVDRTVKYWDLESFQLVSSTDGDSGPISCIYFSPDGECLFSGGQDLLKVYGWEPARVFDSVVMSWGKVADIATAQNQLIGASFVQTNVSIYIVDLKRINPFGGISSTPSAFHSGSHVRKSFNRQKPINHGSKSNNSVQMKTEDSETITPEIDPGDDSTSVADIKDIDDYKAIFHPRRRELVRTPPPPGRVDPFPAPPEDNSQRSEAVTPPEIIVRPEPVKPEPMRPKTEPIIRPEPKRADRVSPRTSPRAEPRTIVSSRTTSPRSETARFEPSRAELACADSTLSEPVHTQSMLSRIETVVSETVIQKSESRPPIVANTSAVSSSSCEPVVRNVTPSVVVTRKGENQNIVSIKTDVHSNKVERTDILDYIPTQRDRPVGLDLDDFLPFSLKTFHDTMRIGQQAQPEISEAEAISSIIKGHESMLAVLTNRHRHIQIVLTMWSNKDIKTAIESAVHMGDQAVMVDILNVICLKPSLWSLDLSVILLPSIYDLVQSKYEIYMLAGCQALRIVLKNFASVIKTNITAPPSIGIDLQREERYNKCMSCYNQLVSIRAFILKRQTLQGKLGQTFRELHILLQVLD